jgi:hypothetical protein
MELYPHDHHPCPSVQTSLLPKSFLVPGLLASPRVSSITPLPFSQVTLPVYLNFTRADLIFTVDFEIATKEDPRSFYERGVAVLCTE